MKIHKNIYGNIRFSLLVFLFLGLLASFLPPRILHAQDARISDFTVSNSESQLLLYLTVTDCFTADMEAAIQNGIPATFTFYVEIFRKRSNWPDKKVREYEFDHVMEYDSLKKEYRIARHEKGDNRTTASLVEAKALMSEINGYKMLPLSEFDPESSYVIRVKAKLARKTLPLYFHYLIPFISLWDFETEWHELSLRLAL